MKTFICIAFLGIFTGYSSAQGACGANFTILAGETVQVTSPNHPDPYPNNADCLWRVHAPDLSQLSVSCPQVDLQWTIFGCVDTLAFSDVENFNQLPSYCGNHKPPSEVGFGDTVFIRFLSDGSGTDNGFVCNVTATTVTTDPDCECGAANSKGLPPQDRVWNGVSVAKHEYPWLALLMTPDSAPKVLCGAVLINSHYVLTSASCVQGIQLDQVRVRLGEHDLMNNNESPPHKIHDIELIKVHPNFNNTNLNNDLALIRVGEQILYESNIKPACLPQGIMNLDQTQLLAAGWGGSSATTTQVTLPRQTFLDVDPATLEECSALLPPSLAVREGQLCTTTLDGSDVCTGDFGGPLVQEIDGVYYLVAISSFNTECGKPLSPTVHSRIDYHLSWITAASADGIQCGVPVQ